MEAPQPLRPLLASEALRDDLAPLAPLADQAKKLCLLAAAGLACCAASLLLAVGSQGAISGGVEGLSAAAVSLAIGLLHLPYQARAHIAAGLGATLLALALAGRGPAGALLSVSGTSLPWEIARVAAALLLPSALLLRAHYRAFPRTRVLLAWGLVFALPFVIRSSYVVLFASHLSERVAASTAVASFLLALLGFMGSHTTAGGSLWAACLLGSLALDIAARLALPSEASSAALHLTTALAFLLGAGLGAFGLFQSLASAIAPAARSNIDDRRKKRGLGSRALPPARALACRAGRRERRGCP